LTIVLLKLAQIKGDHKILAFETAISMKLKSIVAKEKLLSKNTIKRILKKELFLKNKLKY
jgi:hypothetical protein